MMALKSTENNKKNENRSENDTSMDKSFNEDNTQAQDSRGTRKRNKPGKKTRYRNKLHAVSILPSSSGRIITQECSKRTSLPRPPYSPNKTTYYPQNYPMITTVQVANPMYLPFQPVPVLVRPFITPVFPYNCAVLAPQATTLAPVVAQHLVTEIPAMTYTIELPPNYTNQINNTQEAIASYANQSINHNDSSVSYSYLYTDGDFYVASNSYPTSHDAYVQSVNYGHQSTDAYVASVNNVNGTTDVFVASGYTTQSYDVTIPSFNYTNENTDVYEAAMLYKMETTDSFEASSSYTTQATDLSESSGNYTAQTNDTTDEPSILYTPQTTDAFEASSIYTTQINESYGEQNKNVVKNEEQIDETQVQIVEHSHNNEDTANEKVLVQRQYLDPFEIYLTLPRTLFPAHRTLTVDPNTIIDAFCRLNNVDDHVLWLLDLEFGIPRYPVTHPIPIYDIHFNSIHCRNTPAAIHPGFDSCDEDFKKVLLFYYDCMISSLYTGYVRHLFDVSVENFISWIHWPMQVIGMCWP